MCKLREYCLWNKSVANSFIAKAALFDAEVI